MSTELAVVTPISPNDDPFGGSASGILASEIKPSDKMCIAIVGPPKTGKSWLSATMPKPIIIYDFDNRGESLAGKEGIKVVTLQDLDQKNPVVAGILEGELENFKYRKKKGQLIPKTVVFDSMSMLETFIKNSYMQQAGGDSYRTIKISPTKSLRHAQGWDAVNGMKEYMVYFIAEFRQLMNVVVVFHERDEKDKAASTKLEIKYTGRTTTNPQYLEDLLIQFNDVYRIDIAPGSGKFQVQVEADHDFRACNSLGLKGLQEPDIMKMIESHKSQALVKK